MAELAVGAGGLPPFFWDSKWTWGLAEFAYLAALTLASGRRVVGERVIRKRGATQGRTHPTDIGQTNFAEKSSLPLFWQFRVTPGPSSRSRPTRGPTKRVSSPRILPNFSFQSFAFSFSLIHARGMGEGGLFGSAVEMLPLNPWPHNIVNVITNKKNLRLFWSRKNVCFNDEMM